MSDQSPFEKKVIRRTPIDKPTPLTYNLGEALKRLKVDNPPVQTADKKQVKAKITKISKIVAKVSISGRFNACRNYSTS